MSSGTRDRSSIDEQTEGFRIRLKQLVGEESIRSFSRKSGVSEGTIRSYMEGRNMPTLEKIILLADAGGKSVEWLTTGKEVAVTTLQTTTLKTAQLIEQLSEENQREILHRIKALHRSDQREQEIDELKEMMKVLIEKVG